MKNLDQYIKNNKHLFEEEPASGHFERLQQKMNKKHRTVTFRNWSIAIAASVAILISIGIFLQHQNKPNNMTLACEKTDDMKLCYMDKMNDVAQHIEVLSQDFDQWDQEQVMENVKEIIEANDDLENEIPEELPKDATRSILSDYYRHNLESLNAIAKNLEDKVAM